MGGICVLSNSSYKSSSAYLLLSVPHASSGATLCPVLRGHYQPPQRSGGSVQRCQPQALLHQGVLPEGELQGLASKIW